MSDQLSSSDKPLMATNQQSTVATGALPNSSTTPINQGPTRDGQQPSKKRKKRKKRNGQNRHGGARGAQSGLATGQPKTPQQPPPGKQQKQSSKPPNLGVAPKAPAMVAARVPTPPARNFQKFNELPLELQKRIFEIAYHICEGHGSREEWIFMSHKVREWIEPFLYESIVLPEDFERGSAHTRLELYERTFRSRPKEFYTKSVRRIFTNNNTKYHNSDFELELLPICDNLTSLECWSDPREELKTILRTKSWPKLKTLCIDIDLLPKDENTFHLPIFQHVTHLDFTSNDPQLPSWESLRSLEKLTHMRVYMLVQTKSKEFRLATDQTYAIATEAQKCFPPNLKHFVILVPVDLLYYISSMERRTAEDKQRWERMESLRLGTFDPRVMLGCSGNWDEWLDGGELSDVEEDGISSLEDYAEFIAPLTYPNWPRDHLDDEEKDTWLEVVLRDRKRKKFLASQKK